MWSIYGRFRDIHSRTHINKRRFDVPKPKSLSSEKSLIGQRLIELRKQHNFSQRGLTHKLQLSGYDMDKNVITIIETTKRYVTDIELKAFVKFFHVSYNCLIN